jgi:hypothetical protein
MAIPSSILKWRKKQKPGAIMKPSTFQRIARRATKKYGSKKRGEEAAGKAYWGTVKAKAKKARKK